MVCIDLLLLALLTVGTVTGADSYITVAPTTFALLGVCQAVFAFIFVVALDEYKPCVTSLYEKGIIFLLAHLYSYILLILMDLLLRTTELIPVQGILAGVGALVLILVNGLATVIFRHLPGYIKPRLLIVETNNTDMGRMKRVKYGTLSYYDSWYESVNTNFPADIEKLLHVDMHQYDAVCLLDSVDVALHDRVVKEALDAGIDLFVVPHMNDIGRSNSSLNHFDDVFTLYIPGYQLGLVNAVLKRATDLLFALVMLVITAIPMAVVALAIKITSPGPVFYCQERLTKDHKPFMIYKFRTMIPDAEKYSGPVLAQKEDPRITPIGKFLRACRLDELPQLFNILKGDMSVVGPRPERPFFVEQYEREMEYYKFRYAVKAGLTGLSHVYGRYSTYTYDRTCYDLMYITHYSYLLDLKIMLLTSKIMFMKSAAEGEDQYKRAYNKKEEKKEEPVEK